ncbi:hypothetical protein U8335_19800 [Roseiconus lacunae]|uniref:hypothetical protein n=1 Tax=Roseiconus lacunae TaxID=2605694 RepID=UPI0030894D7A|nr:hypothetical protein U8335_19800 [Stieleria sp. HD01]
MQYTVTVDTEEEWDWSSSFRTSYESVENIKALPDFQSACDRLGVKATYFVNHSVLKNHEASARIRELNQHPNVEIGFHIHPWNTPPYSASEEVVPTRESFLHNVPREIAIQKLDTVLEAFADNDIQPTSFRGGRYSTSTWIQDHLFQHGCIADASVLPFTTWADEGAPDFRDRDLTPRRRSMGDGAHGLWEIPLTLAFTRKPWRFWHQFYQAGERTPLKQLRCIGIAERTLVKKVWLNLEHPLGTSIEALLPILRRSEVSTINFTLHSSSLAPGLNPYTRTASDLKRLYARLESAVAMLNGWHETSPATVTEVARHLEAQYHENSRN